MPEDKDKQEPKKQGIGWKYINGILTILHIDWNKPANKDNKAFPEKK